MTIVSPLTKYESARRMLAEARRVDEVMHVRDGAERLKLYARQARDRDLMADAMEISERAKRKLGSMLIEAKEAGQIREGRPKGQPAAPENRSEPEQFTTGDLTPITLADAGIDRKLSMLSQQLARVEEEVFEAGIARARQKIVSGGAAVVNPARDVSTAGKKAARAEKEARLGARQRALPEAKFGVILTDDEWEHRAWSDDGLGKAAANHYPVSGLDELKKRDVASLAAEDCALFMWTTVPHLAQALELMAHRGFAYKSNCIWRKVYPGDGRGMGYWFWIDHEILLVGTRGNIPAPAPGTQWRSVIEAPVGVHSAKPGIFHQLIESYYPSLPKVELNARGAREGWVSWGYEAPEEVRPVARAEDFAPIPAPKAADQDSQAKASEGKASVTGIGPALDGDASRPSRAGGSPAPLTAESIMAGIDAKVAEGGDRRKMADAAIRAGYALDPFDPAPIVAVVSAVLGRVVDKAYVKKRAHQLGLGSRDRQRAAATAWNLARGEATPTKGSAS